jgi:hypothetical protein
MLRTMMLLTLSLAARAACPAALPASALEPSLASAERAVASLDSSALDHALEEARDTLRCLGEVPSPEVVSRYFGLEGIGAYVAGSTEQAMEAFAVPRRSGAWSPPKNMSGPLRQVWDSVDPAAPDAPRPLAPVAPGSWAVDGATSSSAPSTRPFFLQQVSAPGGVDGSWLLAAGEALPAVALPPVVVDAPAPAPVPIEPQRHTSRTLLFTGVGAVVLGAGAAATAAVLEGRYMHSAEPDSALVGLKTTNQVLGWGAVGLFAAGGGLGTSAVVVGSW